MNRRDRLAWGLVGALAFLVLVQGYELVLAVRLDLAVKGLVALAVGVATGWLAPRVARRVGRNGSA